MLLDLPSGPRGRLLALGLLLVALGVVWLGAVSPLLTWYGERAELVAQRCALATRMAAVADTLPRLRREAAGAGAAPRSQALLGGGSDAVAGADLQTQVEAIATRAGTSVSSLELLPVEAAGPYRRVALRVTVSGAWPAFVQVVTAIDEASPRMLVNDLQLQTAPSLTAGAAQPLTATFTVLAFRTGASG